LTRSCRKEILFTEVFFMAIPPEKCGGGSTARESYAFQTCRIAFPLALAWQYYSTRFSWKIVDKLTSDG
jgi:hypothetical protein